MKKAEIKTEIEQRVVDFINVELATSDLTPPEKRSFATTLAVNLLLNVLESIDIENQADLLKEVIELIQIKLNDNQPK